MYLVNNEEMRELDYRAIEEWEIPSVVLMENAGLAVLKALEEDVDALYEKSITILCGSGNNGGDGLVLARQLQLRHASNVTVVMVYEGEKHESREHAINRAIIEHMEMKMLEVNREDKLNVLRAQLNFTDVVVDCIFGTGLSRDLSDFYTEVIDIVNEKNVLRVCVDIPSGLNGNDGMPRGNAIRADYTYTLAWPKQGLFVGEAAQYVGSVRVLPIGIPENVANASDIDGILLEPSMLAELLPKRTSSGYKNRYGHVGVIAGSVGMSGACVMAAKAAMRSGAGLVTALVDKGIYTAAASAVPEVMMKPVSWPSEAAVEWLVENTDVQMIGPGMGKVEEKQQVLYQLLAQARGKLVIDADALTILAAGDGSELQSCEADCILTPHPGEMARLLGMTNQEVQADRLELARGVAEQFECVVVLKGHNTIVASPDGRFAINPCDSVALATAGSGDVLSGVIAAFAAQGLSAFDAACMGVLLHGLAGEQMEKQYGTIASTASDIIEAIPSVLKDWMTGSQGKSIKL